MSAIAGQTARQNIYMSAIAGQTARQNGLKFVEKTHGARGVTSAKNIRHFSFQKSIVLIKIKKILNSINKISIGNSGHL